MLSGHGSSELLFIAATYSLWLVKRDDFDMIKSIGVTVCPTHVDLSHLLASQFTFFSVYYVRTFETYLSYRLSSYDAVFMAWNLLRV